MTGPDTEMSGPGGAMTGPDTDPGPAHLSRHGTLGAAGAAAAALLLAGCGNGDRLPPGASGDSTDATLEGDWLEKPPAGDDYAMELPGVRYEVTACGTTPTLDAALAKRCGLPDPSDADSEQVRAADGETFLLATVRATAPRIMPRDFLEKAPYTERILVGGTVHSVRAGTLRTDGVGLGPTLTIAVSVPEGAAEDHVAFEVVSGGHAQRLSLATGKRLESDLDMIYAGMPTARAEANWWQRTLEGDEHRPTIAGFLLGAEMTPVLTDGTWPATGHLLLGMVVSTLPPGADARETSTIELVLPDGSTAETQRDPSRAFSMDRHRRDAAWFEVPADARSATARVHLSVKTPDGKDHDLGTEKIALEITRPS